MFNLTFAEAVIKAMKPEQAKANKIEGCEETLWTLFYFKIYNDAEKEVFLAVTRRSDGNLFAGLEFVYQDPETNSPFTTGIFEHEVSSGILRAKTLDEISEVIGNAQDEIGTKIYPNIFDGFIEIMPQLVNA